MRVAVIMRMNTESMKSEHITEVEQSIPPSRLKRFLELAGSFYGVGLLVSALAAVAFAWLASEVLEHEFVDMNRNVLLWIHTFSSPFWDTAALTLTWLGSGIGVTVLMLTVMAVFLYKRRALDAVT